MVSSLITISSRFKPLRKAVIDGLFDYDNRHGWRGPEQSLPLKMPPPPQKLGPPMPIHWPPGWVRWKDTHLPIARPLLSLW